MSENEWELDRKKKNYYFQKKIKQVISKVFSSPQVAQQSLIWATSSSRRQWRDRRWPGALSGGPGWLEPLKTCGWNFPGTASHLCFCIPAPLLKIGLQAQEAAQWPHGSAWASYARPEAYRTLCIGSYKVPQFPAVNFHFICI